IRFIRLLQGDRAGAEAAYALAGPVRSWAPMAAMRMACLGHGLAVAIGLQRAEDIEFFLAQFEPFRGRHLANGAGAGVYMGPGEIQLGLAAAAPGRLDAAVEDLAAAASICDANGARGYAVQARAELAGALVRRQAPDDLDRAELAGALVRRQAPDDLDRARAVLDAAAGEAERLGMVPFTERIGRLGAQLRDRLLAADAAASPLSPRELEVATLVARRMTNKQIGATLFVSERTAENHVQHILVKLGFSNRSQIAAWLAADAPADRE
ncbi:MAG: helix-turn-helix transcriptional regulator, partial [Streptosporangiaceae bacterium]